MTNVTTQSGAIRTLTEEEMAVVSGGLSSALYNILRTGNVPKNTNFFRYFPASPKWYGIGWWGGSFAANQAI